MWTATLDSFKKDGGNVVCVVTFRSDSGESVTETVRGDTLDATALKAWCGRWIASRQSRDACFATLATGPIDPTIPGS